MDKTIVVESLTKKYKNDRGIENISFEVGKGEIFGFLGPNGAGKTTAMKIMTGLIHADSGKVYINGYSVNENIDKALYGVGCIIETAEPYPYLTAYENMKTAARFYGGISDKKIDECLERTGILQYKNERAKGFSLGMKQRLGISMTILNDPSVVIWDEPLNGLDVEGMVEMRNLITDMARENKTTFFISSHLIHDVELTCTRVGIVYGGRYIGGESTEKILENYSSLENYYLSEVDLNARL